VVAFVALLVVTVSAGPVHGPALAGSFGFVPTMAAATDSWNIGSGFIGFSPVQDVQGAAYFASFCSTVNLAASCEDPIGLSYVAPANIVVLTEGNGSNPNFPPLEPPAIIEFDPATLHIVGRTNLSCTPGMPLYPGSGFDVYVPCTSGLLVFNYSTDRVVGTISTPFWVISLAFDSGSGEIYASGWDANGTTFVGEINPAANTLVRLFSIPNVGFAGFFGAGAYLLAYDPATDELLMPNSSGPYDDAGTSILSVNPESGKVTSTFSTGATVLSVSVAPQSNQILVTTSSPDEVEAFNEASYAEEAQVSLPSCLPGVCAGGDAPAVALDPTHGDAYILTSLALDVLNLTTCSLVATIYDYGAGDQGSGVYVPGVDRVFGAYQYFYQSFPGFMVQLTHSSHEELTSVLWLPTAEGILALSGATGTILAILRSRGPPVPPRERTGRRDPMRVPLGDEHRPTWPSQTIRP
jgi:hypothetical protein